MKIIIKTPTKAVIESATAEEIEKIKKALTYTNTSIQFLLTKHRANFRLKNSSPDYYYRHEKELLSQLRTCLLYRDREGNDWTFPGILPYLEGKFNIEIIRNEIVYPILKPVEWKQKPAFEPYPYQKESVERLINEKHGSVDLPTGAGKTNIIQTLCKNAGLQTAIVTPSSAIFNEVYESMIDLFGEDKVGAYGDSKKKLGKIFTVCVSKSLTMLKDDSPEKDFFKKTQHMIMDECFPYGTKIKTDIGPTSIGCIVGNFINGLSTPKILSFNEKTKTFEYKKIINAWRRPIKPMIRITCGLMAFRCTENHKILTSEGWKKAIDLHNNDLIISSPSGGTTNSNLSIPNDSMMDLIIGSFFGDGNISYTKNNNARVRINHGIKQKEYALWKLSLFGEIKGADWIVEKNGYAKTPAIMTTTKTFYLKEYLPSDKTYAPEWAIDKLNLKSLAIWFLDDGSICKNKKNGHINSATLSTHSFDEDTIDKLIIKLSKMGYLALKGFTPKGIYLRFRCEDARRLVSDISPYCPKNMSYKLNNDSKIATEVWHTDIEAYKYSKVTDVRKYEVTIKGSRKKCENYLFDIEVEDNHNFLVGSHGSGIVAHNCHTLSTDTLEEVCHGVFKDVPYRHFLSGTIVNNSGKGVLLSAIVGKIVKEMSIGDGIKGGYLFPLNFKIIPVKSSHPSIKKDPIEIKRIHFLRNDAIAQKIASIVNACWNSRQEASLILVEELVQIQMLAKYLTIPFGYVHSGSKKEASALGLDVVKAKEQILRFNMGEIQCIIGTKSLAMGVNLFAQAHSHNWAGGSSGIVTMQGIIGRSTRILSNSKFKQYHKPRSCVYIYDYDVTNKDLLKKHLEKRIEYYESTGGTITYL